MLKGDFVDAVQSQIQEAMKGPEGVFVLLRYVMLHNPWSSETPLLTSWMNASSGQYWCVF